MTSNTMTYLKNLVNIPSPSGYTDEVITYVEDFFQSLKLETMRNNKGGLIVTLPGKSATETRMLTAHVDTLGAMVKEIKPSGRLKLDLIGGFRFNSIEGEYCTIHTASGDTYTGTILMHQTSVHVYKDAGTKDRNQDNMEVRIDAVVKNEADVIDLGIGVGDFVSFDPRVEETATGFIKSRHLDDKASVAMLMSLSEQIVTEAIELPYTTYVLISNNEEIGYGGNSNIPESVVEYLAVDMGAIGDGQTTDEFTVSICAKDSSGPYHHGLRQHLVQLANDHDIGYKVDIYPYYGSDASAAIRAGHDIIHGLIGAGIDSSHAFERTHIDSIKATEQLIYHYLLSAIVPH